MVDLNRFVREHLKLRHLHVLVMLDDTLNTTRAAEQLHVTQASVSRTLAEVEHGLGIPLFERHARGLRRTAPGEEVLRAVRQIIGHVLALEHLAGEFSSLSAGAITIGVHNTSALGRLAAFIADFKATYPLIRFRLWEGLLPDLLRDVQDGRLDMAFGRLIAGLPERRLTSIAVAGIESVIVARHTAPPPPSDPRELLARPWAIPLPGTPMREEFDVFCERHGVARVPDVVETNNVQVMVELLLRQDRYATFPSILPAPDEFSIGRLSLPWLARYPFAGSERRDRTGIIYAAGSVHTPAATAFLQHVQDQVDADGFDLDEVPLTRR